MDAPGRMSESLPVAVLLTLSGGLMDVYSYICRGGVFANAQTGNLVLFGVKLSTGDFSSALRYLLPVSAFALGIAASEFLRHRFGAGRRVHWRQQVLFVEALILFCVAFMPERLNLLANSLSSFACGCQVESFRKFNGSGIATTMCIGNLRAATQSLCDWIFLRSRRAMAGSAIYFLIIGVFILGAVLGNALVGLWGEKAILASSALLLAGGLTLFLRKEC